MRGVTPVARSTRSNESFDRVLLATGVTPRKPKINGVEHEKVLSYVDVLRGNAKVGGKVAIIGAGGIGFDIAEYLSHDGGNSSVDKNVFMNEWGIDSSFETSGGVLNFNPTHRSAREVTMLQRKSSKLGKSLGKSTGWIHRRAMGMRNVQLLGGCEYENIDCLLYTSPSPRDQRGSRMPSSA